MEQNQNLVSIIFLNGTSSSGKTSIANELESRLDGYKIADVDNTTDYADFLPKDRQPSFQDFISAFHNYIIDLASKGKKIIVDHVLQEPEWAKEMAELLAEYEVVLVGVHCPLDVLEQREAQRPERKGNARYQFPKVHVDKQYDVQVDTSTQSPQECATEILAYVNGNVKNRMPTSQKFYKH